MDGVSLQQTKKKKKRKKKQKKKRKEKKKQKLNVAKLKNIIIKVLFQWYQAFGSHDPQIRNIQLKQTDKCVVLCYTIEVAMTGMLP